MTELEIEELKKKVTGSDSVTVEEQSVEALSDHSGNYIFLFECKLISLHFKLLIKCKVFKINKFLISCKNEHLNYIPFS